MGKFFSYDSGLFQAINKIVDCALLSILWLLFSIPIVTIGASSTALYYTVNKVIRHDRSHIWREFWSSFKSNFKQSTIVWLILMAAYYILITNCLIMYQANNTVFLVFYLGTICLLTMWMLHLFPHIARFANTTRAIMKNCALIAIRHILKSLVLLIIFAAACVLIFVWPIVIIIVPTLYTLAANFILETIFRRYMSDEDFEAEEERNRIYG